VIYLLLNQTRMLTRCCVDHDRYVPQALLNFQRKSMYGFSASGVLLKHLGACFLFVNAYITGGTLQRTINSLLPYTYVHNC